MEPEIPGFYIDDDDCPFMLCPLERGRKRNSESRCGLPWVVRTQKYLRYFSVRDARDRRKDRGVGGSPPHEGTEGYRHTGAGISPVPRPGLLFF